MAAPTQLAIRRQLAFNLRTGADKTILREALKDTCHIELRGVPTTATPADIRRAISPLKVHGVSDVAVDYFHFLPTGNAILTFSKPSLVANNLRALSDLHVSGLRVQAAPVVLANEIPARTRGAKGLSEATERGVVDGSGPHAGLRVRERVVTISGLPGKAGVEAVAHLMKGFRVAKTEDGRSNIVKLKLPPGAFSMLSKFLVTMESVTEAHRLVRRLHRTHYMEKTQGSNFPLQARLIY